MIWGVSSHWSTLQGLGPGTGGARNKQKPRRRVGRSRHGAPTEVLVSTGLHHLMKAVIIIFPGGYKTVHLLGLDTRNHLRFLAGKWVYMLRYLPAVVKTSDR